MYIAVKFHLMFDCFWFPSTASKTYLKSKKHGSKAESFCQTFFYLGERGALENEWTAEHGEEWSSAGEERGDKKLTMLIWNQKESATWQSLKSCTCTFIKQALWCASLAPSLSLCSPSFLSLSPSLYPFPFHVLWLGALSFSACFLYTVHSLCVLIAAILGEEENDEEDLFESSRARFCGTTQRGATDTWSAWRARGR